MPWYWWLLCIPVGVGANYCGWRSTFGKEGWPFNWRVLVFAYLYRSWYYRELERGVRGG